jgi:hypothetical protein
MMPNNRHNPRYVFSLPVDVMFGTQIVLKGRIKDLSLKSAFIILKSSIHMTPNDELDFLIIRNAGDPEHTTIKGSARISRIAVGEGIAIFFTKMDKESLVNLEQLIGAGARG